MSQLVQQGEYGGVLWSGMALGAHNCPSAPIVQS